MRRLVAGMLSMLRDLVLSDIAGGYLCPRTLRMIIYRCFGMKIKTNHISPKCFIGGTKLSVGKGSFINYMNFFDLSDNVTIEENVHVAMCCRFVTSTHKIGDNIRRGGNGVTAPILVENGCWIGANVTILPGVTIHEGTIIAAGAVVTRDCEANSLYGGVPAKKIKQLP